MAKGVKGDFVQALFWNNFPGKRIRRKMKSFGHLSKLTFLKDFNEPYIIFTGTNKINLHEIFREFQKDKKIFEKLKKRNLHFFMFEPVSFYLEHKDDHNLGYYSEFHDSNKDIDAEELSYINRLGKKIGHPINLNHCDYGLGNLLGMKYPYINFYCRDLFLRYSSQCQIPDIDFYKKITKPFWCGNGRYTVHRHLIMCYLADKPGNYSWHFQANTSWKSTLDWVEDNLPLEYLKENNEILCNKNFNLDFEAEKTRIVKNNEFGIPEGPVNNKDLRFFETYLDCFVAIINETRFGQPTANFSEKVIDAINYRRPFIVVAPPKTLEYMKKLGFETFSDFWDESYDQEENHSKRLEKIFQVIDFINSKSLDELNKWHRELKPRLEHNRSIVESLREDGSITDDQ